MRSFPEQAVRVRALAGDIVLCSWARHFTLTVPLSTQEYKWVPAICWGNLTNCGEVTCGGLAFRPGGVEILLAASCYGNRDKLRQYEPVWLIRLHSLTHTISSQKYVAQKCSIFYVRFPTEKETWYFADALYTWSSTVTSLMGQACSLMPCRSSLKVYVLCLLIVSAACQSGSPLSCDEDVTSNLPGILEENM